MRKQVLADVARSVLKGTDNLQSGRGTGTDPAEVEREVWKALVRRAADERAEATAEESRAHAATITRDGFEAARALDAGAVEASLTDQQWSALQVIVEVTGRPALRLPNGIVENASPVPANEHWNVLLGLERKTISRRATSVGRITLGESRVVEGTAWRVGRNSVVTNRHVVRGLVQDAAAPLAQWRIDQDRHPTVNFAATAVDAEPSTFPISEVVFCVDDLDLALLRLGDTGRALPPKLAICWTDSGIESGGANSRPQLDVYVIGHPWRIEGSTAIERVFGRADGTKRCSFGYVVTPAGADAVFEHDCSTLGGNSGSCVVSAQTHEVVGLHFGGANPQQSGIGEANLAILFESIIDHPAHAALQAA